MADMTYDSVRYLSLRGRGVLITGGASGIGEAMARGFAAQGARVDILDVDDHAIARLTADVPGIAATRCDVCDTAALRAAIATIERDRGAIDVLVNNAARDDRHAMTDVRPEDWRRYLAVNLDHQFFATQCVSGYMIERGHGAVILMGSVSGMRGRAGMVGYTTAKAGINGMNKTLSRELGPSGIRVNCIVPGAILTERQEKLWVTPEMNQRFLDDQALKFRMEAHHVARMALFVASDECCGCTGANFVVDAGLT
jgi:NAD(P)-dependent dehydrogenase (short-subunit alcohol dehydrogenase family)